MRWRKTPIAESRYPRLAAFRCYQCKSDTNSRGMFVLPRSKTFVVASPNDTSPSDVAASKLREAAAEGVEGRMTPEIVGLIGDIHRV